MQDDAEMQYLHDLAAAVVEASRVRPGERVSISGPNTSGGTLIRPGGRDCYPAFWIRDFTLSLESGLITAAELEHALITTAKHQQAKDWHTPSGSFVPRGAIPDHIPSMASRSFSPAVSMIIKTRGASGANIPPWMTIITLSRWHGSMP